jgi:coatomer subunit beta'
VVVCGDGEFIIYTALAWRNKSFGQALEFVWAQDSNEYISGIYRRYAIRESTSKIRLFRSFKEKTNVAIKPPYSAEGIFGGVLLGVRSSSFVVFYDWETGVPVRRIDVAATNVYWSDTDMLTITTADSFYVLKFNRAAFQAHLEAGVAAGEEGYQDCFDLIAEIPECVSTGSWTGDCFIYTNSLNRLNYLVGGQASTLSHFDRS